MYYILEHGKDCDGQYTKGRVIAIKKKKEMTKRLNELADWSDGLTYSVTTKKTEVSKYTMHHHGEPYMPALTIDKIKEYFELKGWKPRHSLPALKHAANKLSAELHVDAFDILLLIVSNHPIEGQYTHSYGFHTARGRYIIEKFTKYYNSKS